MKKRIVKIICVFLTIAAGLSFTACGQTDSLQQQLNDAQEKLADIQEKLDDVQNKLADAQEKLNNTQNQINKLQNTKEYEYDLAFTETEIYGILASYNIDISYTEESEYKNKVIKITGKISGISTNGLYMIFSRYIGGVYYCIEINFIDTSQVSQKFIKIGEEITVVGVFLGVSAVLSSSKYFKLAQCKITI